ncbi:MAG: 5'-nucleotidase C-terminal domain-containing protein [Gemmatimonadaceae bacterium]
MPIRYSLAAAALLAAAGCVPSVASPAAAGGDTFDLVIAGTTDQHGRVRGFNYETNRPDSARGLSRAATIIDSVRRDAPGRVVLLDAGDLLQGNSLTFVAARVAPAAARHPVMAAMNVMKYDASAVGNHEFNYGVPFLEATIKQANFAFLAANAYRPNGAHAFPSWTLVNRGSVRVGVVGATTPGSMVWDRDNLKDRLVIRDIVPELVTAVRDVRSAGADVVVVTMHSGLTGESSYDTVSTGLPSENVAARVAREVSGVDVILFGHSHQEVADTMINGVLLMQPKNWATSVAVAHVALSRAGGRWSVMAKSSKVIQAVRHAEDAAVLAATDSAHRATVAWVNQPIGRTPVAWRADSARVVDTPLIDFILDVERAAAGTDLASTAAFSLDATLDSGTVTAARMQALYPYDNTLRGIRITGQQLRDYLEQSARYYVTSANGRATVNPAVPGFNFDIVSGADYTLDVSRPAGQRVTRLEVRGKPVQPADTFTMALNNYRQSGGGGYAMLASAPLVYDKQQEIRQLLVDEVRRKGTLLPADYFTRNWRLEPAAAIGSLQAELHRNNREDAHATGTVAARGPRPFTRLRIIGTNDFHGALEPRPDASGKRRGGVAYIATAMKNAAMGCSPPACETILLDGGDEFQGTPASNLAFGRPVVTIFNKLGYAAGALGNHEFDWSQDTLRARMREAHYAILGANVRYADGRDVPWIRDDTLVTRGALKVGVIGVATTSTPSTTKASNVSDLRFLEPAAIVDSLARRLRTRGADYVIVIAHSGAFCDRDGATNCNGEIVDLARALKEPVDAIVSGHTHSLVDATIAGIPIVQARSSGTAIDVVDLGPGGSTHSVRDVVADSLVPDPEIASLVASAVATVAPFVNRPVATIAANLQRDGSEYPLGNLIADAMRAGGKGDVAVMNNGGIRANMRAGQATYGSLFEIQPFGNILYRVTVGGTALRQYLEKLVARRPNVHVSGVTIQYDTSRAAGSRIVTARLSDGREIRPDAQYALILNDFLATGGDGLGVTTGALRTEILQTSDLDALVAYLRTLPQPVVAPAASRFIVSPPAR